MQARVLLWLPLLVTVVFAAKKENSWPVTKQCSADAPGYIVDNEIVPWMIKSLDELSELSSTLIDKINEGLEFLEPHVDQSPMFHLDREEYFTSIKANIDGYFNGVYDDVLTSWRNISTVNERMENRFALMENPYACVFALGSVGGYHPYEKVFDDLKHMAVKIQEAQWRSSGVLRSVLQELSVTTQAIIMNSLTIIMDSLNLKEVDAEDGNRLLTNNLARVAPNFLGLVLRKIIKKGSDPDNYKKINKNVLSEIEEVHYAMQEQLRDMGSRCYPCTKMHRLFHNFWRSQANSSKFRVRGIPTFTSDIRNVYHNEEFLSEVTLSLMASFKSEPIEEVKKTQE